MCELRKRPRTLPSWDRSIGQFQLIQLKLAKNGKLRGSTCRTWYFRPSSGSKAGKQLTLAEASAIKLYSPGGRHRCLMEAVQLFGGSGYAASGISRWSGSRCQVADDLRRQQRVQVTHIAKGLLGEPGFAKRNRTAKIRAENRSHVTLAGRSAHHPGAWAAGLPQVDGGAVGQSVPPRSCRRTAPSQHHSREVKADPDAGKVSAASRVGIGDTGHRPVSPSPGAPTADEPVA